MTSTTAEPPATIRPCREANVHEPSFVLRCLLSLSRDVHSMGHATTQWTRLWTPTTRRLSVLWEAPQTALKPVITIGMRSEAATTTDVVLARRSWQTCHSRLLSLAGQGRVQALASAAAAAFSPMLTRSDHVVADCSSVQRLCWARVMTTRLLTATVQVTQLVIRFAPGHAAETPFVCEPVSQVYPAAPSLRPVTGL